MKKYKFKVVFYIVAVLIASFIGVSIFQAIQSEKKAYAENWISHFSSYFSAGTGESTSPYEIADAGQLARMIYLVNNNNSAYGSKYYKLVANIDISDYDWTPIGLSSSTPFRGVFSGNKKAIAGLKLTTSVSYLGLFGYISGATVSNLFIIDGKIVGNAAYIGSTVGYAISSTITNVISYVNIASSNTTASTDIGGIVGFASYSYLSNLVNYGTVLCNNNSMNVGGIAGEIISGSLSYSFNNGQVRGKENVGGLVGHFSSSESIKQSYNIGTVSGATTVGGIVGFGESTSSNFSIYNVYNEGKLTYNSSVSTDVKSCFGGIIGKATRGSIYNLYNKGTLSCDVSSSVGGIVGYAELSSIFDTSNSGSVTGKNLVAGIVGIVLDSVTLSNNLNQGTVTGVQEVAGIVGSLSCSGANKTTTVTKNGNIGIVSATDTMAGGIVCDIYPEYDSLTYNITENYNAGKVSSQSVLGGIVAYISTGSKTVPDNKGTKIEPIYPTVNISCNYNVGTLSATKYLGGILGQDYDISTVTLSYNFHYGCITIEQANYDNYMYLGALTGDGYYATGYVKNYFIYDAGQTFEGYGISAIGDSMYRFGFVRTPGDQIAVDKYNTGKFGELVNYSSNFVNRGGYPELRNARYTEISNLLDSFFNTDSTINSGKPYLKQFYWKDSV